MHRLFSQRRGTLLVTALAAAAAFLSSVPAATATPAPHAAGTVAVAAHHATPAATTIKKNDVYIRDVVGDNSTEPDPNSFIWESPDIWVCNTAAPCTGTNPIAGATNYVNVQLNNTGPGAVSGDLYVYYTSLGGAANWPADWTPVSTLYSISVPASGTQVTLPWASVPGPGHFCLLARWVSAADPMTYPEGLNTLNNTDLDNNIGWHNVDTVKLSPAEPTTRPFTLGNDTGAEIKGNLVIGTTGQPFVGPGTLTIDLGPVLGARWKQAGQPGTGVKAAGGTLVQIVDPKQAVIQGLLIEPKERFQATLTFSEAQPVSTTVLVDQTDGAGNDLGGVGYDIVGGQ